MTFEVIGNQFVKDGKPVKLISGAVHYFRNMPDTWQDIFKKMRAMGCNCVETYCAWNMHEKKKGEFDFFYDTTTKKVTIRWTCPLAMAQGKNSRYKTKTLPVVQYHEEAFKTAKARVEKELMAIAEAEIKKVEGEAKHWKLQKH